MTAQQPLAVAKIPASSWTFAIPAWPARILTLFVSQLEALSTAAVYFAILAEPTLGQKSCRCRENSLSERGPVHEAPIVRDSTTPLLFQLDGFLYLIPRFCVWTSEPGRRESTSRLLTTRYLAVRLINWLDSGTWQVGVIQGPVCSTTPSNTRRKASNGALMSTTAAGERLRTEPRGQLTLAGSRWCD
jgi:hypothetical protein